ncbi:MAG: transposase, partial [Streptosporangiaceae bacterium]
MLSATLSTTRRRRSQPWLTRRLKITRGMTTRDIQAHLAEVYGAEVSPALISNVTSVVAEEITAWQTR